MKASLLAVLSALVGCGTGPGRGEGLDGGHADAASTADAAADTDGGAGSPDAGRCAVRCGSSRTCCTDAEECVVDRCLPVCPASRCGADEQTCCDALELCVGGACISPGSPCVDEDDCDDGATCEPLVGRCIPIPEGAECNFVPEPGVFTPVVDWEWTAANVSSAPIIVQLTDDNGDETIDGRDVPDVIVASYLDHGIGEGGAGIVFVEPRLTALSGDDGRVLWEADGGEDYTVCSFFTQPAAGDLDGDGTVEVLAMVAPAATPCAQLFGQQLAAFDHEGELEWVSTEPTAQRFIHIADIEGDGEPEVITADSVFRNDGTRVWLKPSSADQLTSVADLDGDTDLEVIASNGAWHPQTGEALWTSDVVTDGETAVARIIVDELTTPGPQVVALSPTTMAVLDGLTGTPLLGPVDLGTFGGGSSTGPLTVADFDGDGRAEFSSAGSTHFLVFDADVTAPPHILWSRESEDQTIGTVGSTVFDFDADGRAELVFADECHVRILDGTDGEVLWFASHTSGTGFEYPLVADVDNDGNAELVQVSNDSFSRIVDYRCDERSHPHDGLRRGVRVYRDALDNWVPTRGIWNQHAYHITNVSDDGAIPAPEPSTWDTHNTWRLNRLPESAVFLSPDLIVVATSAEVSGCPDGILLRARVQNQGTRGVASGMPVAFYAGEAGAGGALLGVGESTTRLLTGEATWVEVSIDSPPLDDEGELRFHAVADDDGTGTGFHSECQEENNAGVAITADCSGLI